MLILKGFCFSLDAIGIPYDLGIDLLGHAPSQMGQTQVETLGISNGSIIGPKGKVNAGDTLC